MKTTPLDLDAFERQCLEDDDLDPDVAERRLAKAARLHGGAVAAPSREEHVDLNLRGRA